MADVKPATYEAPKELPLQAQTQKFQGRAKRTPEDQAEYFYSLKWTHIVFFLSSLAMLLSFVGTMYQDWDRRWKTYQRGYQAMELSRVEFVIQEANRLKIETDGERRRLDAEIARLEAELETKEIEIKDEKGVSSRKTRAGLKEMKVGLEGDHALKMQIMNFKKSDYMTFRYRFDEATHQLEHAKEIHSPRLEVYEQIREREKRAFDGIVAETTKAKAEFELVDALMSRIEDSVIALQKPMTTAKEKRAQLDKVIADGMRRVKREMPQPANAIRNAPGMDFFDPTDKIVQVIVTDMQQEFHFARSDRVDRCHTCHQGIANPTYAAVPVKSEHGEGRVFTDTYLAAFVEHAAGHGDAKDCVVCKQSETPVVGAQGETYPSHVTVGHGAWGKEKADEYTRALAAHPRLDLYVGGASPHPIARFGCTSCHEGDGRETDFSLAVHVPNDHEQERTWKNRYHYEYRELWDLPMQPKKHVYASCRKCHVQSVDLEDGRDYVEGQKLYEKLGCYACHRTDSYQILPKNLAEMDGSGELNRKYRRPGPPLTHIKDKVTPDWMFKWVLAPKDYRLTTRMPHFFGQTNARSVKVGEKTFEPAQVDAAIVASITDYFMTASDSRSYAAPPATPFPPDAKRGELVFEQVGCRACHTTAPDAQYERMKDQRNDDDKYRAAEGASWYRKEFGPNLSAMGSKTNPAWLSAWLRDPKHYFQQTRMGNFRLSAQENGDLVAYLMALKKPEFDAAPGKPAVDPALLDQLIFEQLKSKMPDVDALAELKVLKDKPQWFGRRMVVNYGCYSCHELKPEDAARAGGGAIDWTNTEGIGVELTGAQPWGVKGVDKLAFNFAEYEPPNYNGVGFRHPITKKEYRQVGTHEAEPVVRVHKTRHDFLFNKLINPRVYDGGKKDSLPPDELLRMPNFYLTPEETTLLSTFVLSFVDAEVAGLIEKIKKRPSADEQALARGQRLVRESNCRGCHRLEMDKFKVEWRRIEKQPDGKDKELISNVWLEGRLKRELGAADGKEQLKKAGFPEREGARVLQLDWTSDGCSLEMPKANGGGQSFVIFDGREWWYVEEGRKLPILAHREPQGGEILDHIKSFKKRIGHEYWYNGDPGAQESRFPPYLRTQGIKTQTEWFYEFLRAPYPIRPNLNPMLPDYPGKPSDELRNKVKAEVAKLGDPDAEDDDALAELKKMGAEALPAVKEEFTGATDVVIRWRLLLLMNVAAHPDLSVRMPTFGFGPEEASSIVKYFWVRDQKKGEDVYPHTSFPERDGAYVASRHDRYVDVAKKIIGRDCVACHLYDGKAPRLDDPKGSNKIAPDFNQMETRLRPRWMYAWQRNPSLVYPGTTMTQYGFEDEETLKATIEFILNFQKLKGLRNN